MVIASNCLLNFVRSVIQARYGFTLHYTRLIGADASKQIQAAAGKAAIASAR
jgi:hypothetical protein